jgi:parvulin-like peptidyl-prolyl isomerase
MPSAMLPIGDRSLTADEVLSLITKHRLVPQLVREMLITEAIQQQPISEAEHLIACKNFYQQQQLQNEQDLEQWLQRQRLTRADLTDLINRELQLHKFKTAQWANQIESYFCQRKSQIDQVVFSMVRVKDLDIAEEIYFRLIAKESSFVELAPLYSAGMEANTKGINGPVELGKVDPALAHILVSAPVAEVLAPIKIGDWWVVMQLEKIISAQLDDQMRQQLTEELFNQWVAVEVQKKLF